MDCKQVSLIVPCYNIASVCSKFFASLIEQTYTNIEIIFINDGSTDDTEKVIFSYKDTLEKLGYVVKYIYQENKGLGGAINTGLKLFTGNYLCWADPDDYFEKNSFEIRVKYMEDHKNCAVLTCDANVITKNKVFLVSKDFPQTYKKNQFLLLIKKESIFCPGCHMIRRSAFDKVNPEHDIYEYKRGQNWQLLLPIYYYYEREFLNIPLYNYIVYDNSMSHCKETYNQKITRNNEHLDVPKSILYGCRRTIVSVGRRALFCKYCPLAGALSFYKRFLV